MARTWLSIRVELVEGRGETLWPRPGREFAASRSHTFRDLAEAVDAAFGRWDLAHLSAFERADGERIARWHPYWDEEPEGTLQQHRTRLSRLRAGERFLYTFDFGDGWEHLCTVADERLEPPDAHGIQPERPVAYFGWGDLPDQYGRRFADDDGGAPVSPDPGRADLPALLPHWGAR